MVDEQKMVKELVEMFDWGEAWVTPALWVWAEIPINRCEWVAMPTGYKLLDEVTCAGGCVLTWRDCGTSVVWVSSLPERQPMVICTNWEGQSPPFSQP